MAQEVYECAGGREIKLREGAEPNPFWGEPCPNEGSDDADMDLGAEQRHQVVRLHMCRAHLLALQDHHAARRIS